MQSFVRAGLFVLALLISIPATAQDKNGIKPGFVLKPGTVHIILMRPTIKVGAQSTGGMFEPNADWTAQARENITRALNDAQTSIGNQVTAYDEGESGEGPAASQYGYLFNALADSVIEYQFFHGNRLPTKVRKGQFDWSMGPELAKLKSLSSADYALFINTHDEYGSTGRKVLQIVALLGGIPVTSGVHVGYAGLVNLKTGELVWLNADRQMGGDVRTPEGAQKRVRELLRGFPGRPAASIEQASK